MSELTETDISFDTAKSNYFLFEPETFSGECMKCGKKYKTHLSLSRFCSHKCQLKFLSEMTTVGK